MHFGAANFLFCQEPGVQTTLGKKKKKQVQPERPWAHSLSLRTMPEAWETVIMWAAAWGHWPS